MKVTRKKSHRKKGYALLVVCAFAAVSLTILGGALSWTSSTAKVTERNNTYFNVLAAAEAATEKVVSRISRDFQNYGESVVYSSLPTYRTLRPTSAEDPYWDSFTFNNGAGVTNRTHVERLTASTYTNLNSQYAGLKGFASTYRIVSNARSAAAPRPMTAALMQEIQVAGIPIFQFAIFYTMNLEINPGAAMTVTGRVHSNGTIYTEPNGTSCTYLSDVTAVGDIFSYKSPLDPSTRSPGTVSFQAEHDARVASLTLPIGTNNSPQNVRQVVEIPPTGESAASLMGKQRYYNKADMVLIVSNTTVYARSGNLDGFNTVIPAAELNTFFRTNVSFFNKREGKTVRAVQLDVGALKTWAENSANSVPNAIGRTVSSVFVADKRDMNLSTSQPGVRLVNGRTLPSDGLTVATPNPLYVQGHYNAPGSAVGTSNTANTEPASLVGDAITILSVDWDDAEANLPIGGVIRRANHTTVNAAFLSGIVPSDGVHYSGGVENFPRFLESWSGRTFTYNGSMVVMFYSQTATAPWGGSDVYVPPGRGWAFDVNFMDATKLPPGTPQLLTTIRGEWVVMKPNTIL